MNPAIWLCVFLPIFLLLYQEEQSKRAAAARRVISVRKDGRKSVMFEIVERYIGKECLINTMNSQLTGTVTEVRDGWLSVSNGSDTEAVNLDYVVRIRLYPKKKNGKKKAFV